MIEDFNGQLADKRDLKIWRYMKSLDFVRMVVVVSMILLGFMQIGWAQIRESASIRYELSDTVVRTENSVKCVSREAKDTEDIRFEFSDAPERATGNPFQSIIDLYSAPYTPAQDAQMERQRFIENAGGNMAGIAAEAGYGRHRRDRKISLDEFLRNPDYRDNTQSWGNKMLTVIINIIVPYWIPLVIVALLICGGVKLNGIIKRR